MKKTLTIFAYVLIGILFFSLILSIFRSCEKEEVETYTVSFYAEPEDDEIWAEIETNEKGELQELPENNPTKEGYTFTGWYTRPYKDGKTVAIGMVFTSDFSVYAGWDEKISGDGGGEGTGGGNGENDGNSGDGDNGNSDEGGDGGDGNGGDGENDGGNGNEGDGGDEPTDKPDQPSVPSCEHRDADDDGECDKCGNPYDDGVEETPCEHRDANDDGQCDICGDPYDDGDECNHRDRTDDGLCDYCGEAWDDGIEKEYCNHGDLNDDGKCDLCGEPYEDGNDCAHRDDNNDWSCDNCGITYFDGDENTDMVFMEDVDGEYAPGALLVGVSGYSQPFVLFDFDNENMMDKIQAGEYQDGPILFLIQDAETGGFSAYAVIESAEGSTFENHAEKFWEISNADEIGCNSINQEVVTVSTENGIYVLCALRSDGSLKAIDATMKEAIYAGEDLGCFGGCAFIFVPVSEVDS